MITFWEILWNPFTGSGDILLTARPTNKSKNIIARSSSLSSRRWLARCCFSVHWPRVLLHSEREIFPKQHLKVPAPNPEEMTPSLLNIQADNYIANLLHEIFKELIVLGEWGGEKSCWKNFAHNYLDAGTHFRSIKTVRVIKQSEREKLSGKQPFPVSSLWTVAVFSMSGHKWMVLFSWV